jgi:metal-responsive CopG/Arc/MetJ family transcriptional regulator
MKGGYLMSTDIVRLNITLPKEVAESLNSMTEPRKRSRFIATAIVERIERRQREKLEKDLEEGYRATRQEALAVSKEFETADLEGWDEY